MILLVHIFFILPFSIHLEVLLLNQAVQDMSLILCRRLKLFKEVSALPVFRQRLSLQLPPPHQHHRPQKMPLSAL